MRFLVLLTAIAVPALASTGASAGEPAATAQSVAHFRTIKPALTETDNGLLIEGGYCRQARYAARPQSVRIVKVDSTGAAADGQTVRVLGATGNRSQGCGYYAARANWALAEGDKIEIQPNTGQ